MSFAKRDPQHGAAQSRALTLDEGRLEAITKIVMRRQRADRRLIVATGLAIAFFAHAHAGDHTKTHTRSNPPTAPVTAPVTSPPTSGHIKAVLRNSTPGTVPNAAQNAAVANIIYSNLVADIKYDGLQPSPLLTPKYVEHVMAEARWVSRRLHIPNKFVMGDWFMEMDKGSTMSNQNIMHNNLSNLGNQTSNGFNLIQFPNLNAFAREYLATMESAHVQGMHSQMRIVQRMMAEGFFLGESANSYLGKVEGVEQFVTAKRNDPFDYSGK